MATREHDVHVGLRELADLCGVQRKTAVQWQQRGILPESCCVVSGKPAWSLTVARQWAERTGRLPAE